MTRPIRYFFPGPVWVPEDTRQAMAAPIVPHRSAEFLELYASLQPRLRALFRTRQDVLTATGSSTLVMEAAVASMADGPVLHLAGGAFSERWHAISLASGVEADRLDFEWGTAVDPDRVEKALDTRDYAAVTVVHNETSTGVMNPLAEIARVVREKSDALVLVDAVSSLGGAPVETDAWELDFVVTGSQKALAAPPGLALFTLSERAAARARAKPNRGFYTDVVRYLDKHRAGGTITTAAVPLFYALGRQLERIESEGLERRWERHRRLAERSVAWAGPAGFEYASEAAARSWTVSCLRPPAAIAAATLVGSLAARGYRVASGYGRWKSSTFRIGHMGEIGLDDLDALLEVIDQIVSTF